MYLLDSTTEVAGLTEQDFQVMEEFIDEMTRIHENPMFEEDDMNMDDIDIALVAATSSLNANAREFVPSPTSMSSP